MGNCGSFPRFVAFADLKTVLGTIFTLGSSSAQFRYEEALNIRDIPGGRDSYQGKPWTAGPRERSKVGETTLDLWAACAGRH